MNQETKYIYCEDDIKQAIENTVKDTFNWEYELVNFFSGKVIDCLKFYTNIYRFYDRNCVGCVCGNKECDIATGKGECYGCWEKARRGEIFDCPVRVNGTMNFIPGRGLEKIDISDRDKPHYPVIEVK